MAQQFLQKKGVFLALLAIVIVSFLSTIYILSSNYNNFDTTKPSFWQFKSIDTMKYSRDVSRAKLNDLSFNTIIDRQIKEIADTGATHVAIATPYDEEFIPILQRWVNSARRNHLHVWFRGNWSGWEGWFDYPKIDRAEHIKKTQEFIINHPYLFKDGDIFSACPECENGGPGDPRRTGDIQGHRNFLIDEYGVTKTAFNTIHKNVASNYDSMNGDVAKLIMDPETTKSLDGVVVIDHYVKSPDRLAKDIREFATRSGGKVVLGEFGAPIPDIHGTMSEKEQAEWLHQLFINLVNMDELIGINYWTGVGSSTALWHNDGTAKLAVEEIKKIYNPTIVKVVVKNEIGQNISSTLESEDKSVHAESGVFSMIYLHVNLPIEIVAKGYTSQKTTIEGKDITIVLKKQHEDIFFKIQKYFVQILRKVSSNLKH